MKNLLFILIVLFNFSVVCGQTTESINYHPKGYNKIYLELGGQAMYYSFNYERILETNVSWFPSLKVGTSYGKGFTMVVGFEVNKKINQKDQFIFGLGGSMFPDIDEIINGSNSTLENVFYRADYWGSFKVGYQYSKLKSKWFFGLAITPTIYSYDGSSDFRNGKLVFYRRAGIQLGRYL